MAGELQRSVGCKDERDKNMEVSGRVEDQINDEHLRRVDRIFREADINGKRGLNMQQFRDTMKVVMGNVDEEEIDINFMKVDTNCDGTVDWDEYLNYVLLEQKEKESLLQQNMPLYFPKPLKIIPIPYSEIIVSLQFFPFLPTGEKKTDSGEPNLEPKGPKGRTHGGRFLTISRDAVLNFWTERFKLQRTVYVSQMQHTFDQPIWVTDMACLSNINLLAISFIGRDIEFYDISASKCDFVFSLSELEANVVVINYWSEDRRGVFSVGDTTGTIYIFVSSDVVRQGMFNSAEFKTGANYRIPVKSLLKNPTIIFLAFKVPIHSDWIHQIRFIPELNAIATCCTADKTAIVLTTVPHSSKSKIHTARFQRGMLCFDYSPELNVLVTGGFDRVVRVWNPYVTTHATSALKGHSSAVIHIAVNGKDNRIISISKDMNIRVWDLQDCKCVQNIPFNTIKMGRFPISCIYYNRTTNLMVVATTQIGILQGTIEDADGALFKEATSHDHTLCAALYNSTFKAVVSGSHGGVVSVWDILTGEKVMQFNATPEQPMELTALAFDEPERRLVTGSKNGIVRIWNFNNGALLAELPHVQRKEITGIKYVKERIYVSGWSKRVMWYLDVKTDEAIEYNVWNQYHTEDIFSMDTYGKLLVTASYSGDILIWNINSGEAFCRFNAGESRLPLIPIRVEDKEFSAEVKEGEVCRQQSRRISTLVSDKLATLKTPSMANCANPASKKKSQDHQGVLPVPLPDFQAMLQSEGRMGRLPRLKTVTNIAINPEKLDQPLLAVEKVLFLTTRDRRPDTAILLSSSADGYIYAWSISHIGGLVGKFRPMYQKDVVTCSMFTDKLDQILFTGDSHGYIMMWDIEKYCNHMSEESKKGKDKDTFRLPKLIPNYCIVEGPRRLVIGKEKEAMHCGGSISITPPKLLSSWRCHLKAIVHVEYVARFHLIITASLDCNIRVWTIAGHYIGTFGQDLWCIGKASSCVPSKLPLDLQRAGSCQTLKVLNEGKHPYWNCAKQILENLKEKRRRGKDNPQLNQLVPTDHQITNYTDEQIESTWKMWEEKGKQTSSILGRTYKQKVRHHLPSSKLDIQTDISNREPLRVYKSVPYTNLLPIIKPPTPEILKDSQQRSQEDTELATKRPNRKKSVKRWPHIRHSGVPSKPGSNPP